MVEMEPSCYPDPLTPVFLSIKLGQTQPCIRTVWRIRNAVLLCSLALFLPSPRATIHLLIKPQTSWGTDRANFSVARFLWGWGRKYHFYSLSLTSALGRELLANKGYEEWQFHFEDREFDGIGSSGCNKGSRELWWKQKNQWPLLKSVLVNLRSSHIPGNCLHTALGLCYREGTWGTHKFSPTFSTGSPPFCLHPRPFLPGLHTPTVPCLQTLLLSHRKLAWDLPS